SGGAHPRERWRSGTPPFGAGEEGKAVMTPVVLDHLWQSTLFALLVALLAAAFRKAPAAVRHGLWCAPSVKFLIPFAALAAMGRRLVPAIRLPHAAEPEAAFIA